MDQPELLGTTFLGGCLALHFADKKPDPERLSNRHHVRQLVFKGKVPAQISPSAGYRIQIS